MKSLNGKEIKPGATIVYPVRHGSSMDTRLAKVTAVEMKKSEWNDRETPHVTAEILQSSGYGSDRMKGTVVHLSEIGRMIILDDEPTEHLNLLAEIANQMVDWARQSQSGGWSTHQVTPQMDLASKIWQHLGRHGRYD